MSSICFFFPFSKIHPKLNGRIMSTEQSSNADRNWRDPKRPPIRVASAASHQLRAAA